jgi:hypothetical protein
VTNHEVGESLSIKESNGRKEQDKEEKIELWGFQTSLLAYRLKGIQKISTQTQK